VTNDVFRENAWYFRNAMVRANYTNLQKGVHETTDYRRPPLLRERIAAGFVVLAAV
jgi:hypothetical protein